MMSDVPGASQTLPLLLIAVLPGSLAKNSEAKSLARLESQMMEFSLFGKPSILMVLQFWGQLISTLETSSWPRLLFGWIQTLWRMNHMQTICLRDETKTLSSRDSQEVREHGIRQRFF